MNPSTSEIHQVMNQKGYAFFEQDTKNFNLNLIGIRTATNRPDHFDDLMCVLWKYQGVWNKLQFSMTTDPGLYYLQNPIAGTLGTAIVKEGQYRSLWQLGKHQGKYKALTQKNPIKVIRDFDRDGNLDFTSGREEEGLFGINCHRANASRRKIKITIPIAGCQVFADPNDFNVFLSICEQGTSNWGNSFSYTLLHENDFQAI